MYAIIRTGGKQSKVQEGDVLDIERVKNEDDLEFTPLLVVDDKGKVTSGRKELEKARVLAKVLGPAKGPKVDVFKYKSKSGYRRRQGHRQKYTRIEVTKIEVKPTRARKTETDSDEAKAPPKAKASTGSKKATGETSKSGAKTQTKAKAAPKAAAKSGSKPAKTTTKKATAKTAGADSKKEG